MHLLPRDVVPNLKKRRERSAGWMRKEVILAAKNSAKNAPCGEQASAWPHQLIAQHESMDHACLHCRCNSDSCTQNQIKARMANCASTCIPKENQEDTSLLPSVECVGSHGEAFQWGGHGGEEHRLNLDKTMRKFGGQARRSSEVKSSKLL
jgi:hypothetical protein